MPANTVFIEDQNSNGKAILEKIEELSTSVIAAIKEQYFEDATPWIIGFSGGKDSTAVLQFIFYALADLSPKQRHKEVHVLSNDTLVENPNVVRFLDSQLQVIEEKGKATIVLGTRKAASSNRAASMQQYEVKGVRIRKHSLPNAYVFAPIADMSNQEVWTYLVNKPNPWGADNQKLLDLYRSASEVMECPLVIDTTTASCGNSRFGCWTCTVVDKDRSMTNMIANGEEWMLPLMDYRDWLGVIRNDESKRQTHRRNGQPGIGPFTMETRKEMLERLLRLELQVNQELISRQELSAIQYQWNFDGNFKYSVAEIYKQIKGTDSMMTHDSNPVQNKAKEFKVLDEVCEKHGVEPDHIRELMELERDHLSFLRRHNIFEDLRSKIANFVKEK
ncbi:MAG: hypothetical protein ACE5I1_28905 [bacterium]